MADTVITVLDHLAAKKASNMPHKEEQHLPNLKKEMVDKTYRHQFANLYQMNIVHPVRISTIHGRSTDLFIKVQNVPAFIKFCEWERLKTALLIASTDGADNIELMFQTDAHVEYVSSEHRHYRIKTEVARKELGE